MPKYLVERPDSSYSRKVVEAEGRLEAARMFAATQNLQTLQGGFDVVVCEFDDGVSFHMSIGDVMIKDSKVEPEGPTADDLKSED